MPITNAAARSSYDALAAVRETVSGQLCSCVEYDPEGFRSLYVADAAIAMYEDKDQLAEHFQRIYAHVQWISCRSSSSGTRSFPSPSAWSTSSPHGLPQDRPHLRGRRRALPLGRARRTARAARGRGQIAARLTPEPRPAHGIRPRPVRNPAAPAPSIDEKQRLTRLRRNPGACETSTGSTST